MKSFYRIIIFISANILIWSNLYAQHKESDSAAVQKALLPYFYFDDSPFFDNDTSAYDPAIPFAPNDFFNPLISNNGVLGGFSYSLDTEELFGNLYMNYFSLFSDRFSLLPSMDKILLFRNDTGFTNVRYSMGPKREQCFQLIHSQKISKSFRANIQYNIINAPSAYKNLKTDAAGFYGVLEFSPDSSRYRAVGGAIFGKMFEKQNGGISDLTDFIDTAKYDRFITKVNQYSAKSRQKKQQLFFRQEFLLKKQSSQWSLLHTISSKQLTSVYYDEIDTNLYYPHLYRDSLETYDSIAHQGIENWITLRKNVGEKVKGYLSFYHSNDRFTMNDSLRRESQNYFLTDWRFTLGTHELSFYGYKDIPDIFHSDLIIEAAYSKTIDSSVTVTLDGLFYKLTPSYLFNYYNGNYYQWSIDPDPYTNQGLGLSLEMGENSISIKALFPDKFLFFDDTMGINVSGKSRIIKAQWKGEAKWRHWGEKHLVLWQQIGGDQHVRAPKWMAHWQLFYENHLFKKAMAFELGFSVNFNSSYYANAWNPALQTFFEQNSVQTKDFIYPSLYFNAKIKRVILYLEWQNITQGLLPERYMQIPYYPLQDRGLRFGISWTFFN